MTMSAIIGGLLGLIGLASIVCWVMVLIKIFKDNVGLGVLGIFCQLFVFVYGWVKAKEYQVQKVMMAWTIITVAGIILYFVFVAAAVKEGGGMIQEWEMQQINTQQTDY